MSDTIDQSVRDLLSAENSPIEICENCGSAYVSGQRKAHSCESMSAHFDSTPRVEDCRVMQKYDDGDPDDIVAITKTRRGKAYHETRMNDDGERIVIGHCANRLTDDGEWRFETREFVQTRFVYHPCNVCHDLPISDIADQIDSVTDPRLADD